MIVVFSLRYATQIIPNDFRRRVEFPVGNLPEKWRRENDKTIERS